MIEWVFCDNRESYERGSGQYHGVKKSNIQHESLLKPDMGRYFSDTDRGIYGQKIWYTDKGAEEEEEEKEQ